MKKLNYLLVIVSILALAFKVDAQVFKIDNLWYTVIDNDAKKVKVVPENWPTLSYGSGNKPQGDVVVPATIAHNSETYTVTKIGEEAFRSNSYITSLTLPNTIESVDTNAIRGNSELLSVVFAEGGTQGCIVKRSGLAENFKLKTLKLHDKLTTIQTYGLNGLRKLEELVLPESLTTVYETAFAGDKDYTVLINVICNAITPPSIVKENGDPSSSGNIFGNLVLSNITLIVPYGSLSNYNNVTPWKNFNRIVESNMPVDAVFKIDNLWYKVIDDVAKKVKVVPQNYPTLSYNSGQKPSGEVEVPATVEHPGNNETYFVAKIGEESFRNNSSITSLTLPNTIESVDTNAIRGNSGLLSVVFAQGGTQDCVIKRSGLTENAFLTTLVLPDNLTTVQNFGLNGLVKLVKLVLPKNLSTVYETAFNGDNNNTALTDVICKATIPPSIVKENGDPSTSLSIFGTLDLSKITLTVPKNAVGNYNNVTPWKNFKEIKEAITTNTAQNQAFNDLKIYRIGNDIIIDNIVSNIQITVFNLQGQIITDVISNKSTKVSVPNGIYLLKIDNNVLKIIL
jgi:hypothetical protein